MPEFASPRRCRGEDADGQLLALPEPRVGDLGQATGAVGDVVEVVGQQPDDLAEAQGDDGQVVAAQPQRREPRISPEIAVNAIASGTHDSQAQSLLKQPGGPSWFHGLSGLVNSATVYAPTA